MRRRFLLFLIVLLGWAGEAAAAVEIHFHSKDMASTFPHGFIRLTGTDDSTGQPVDTNYGFTPVSLTPSILFGPVPGAIQRVDPAYIARSDRHFTLKLTPEQYRTVMAIVERWRAEPQPSYRLNSRNCVHFIAEIASALGLYAPVVPQLMKKPKSFLRKVAQDNLALIEQWPARHALAVKAPPPAIASVAAPPRPAQ